MYLKSIEISGFKSFAKKVELDFSSPISAIVGPNGSGKSNIAESFRFVLGEQSVKSLRGKRGEDLIWNGSAEVPRAPLAKVRAVFDNSSRFLALDFDEVTIERVVHRDGMNEYFLNGSLVRLKDVIELLAGAHVGASGHHIISQGEADRILNASVKERKTMIEEALGLKVYQYKKVESEKKLEKTEENISQVESLRREIAPHIKFLKKQVEKVEKAALMKAELLELSKTYFATEHDFIEKSKKTLEEEKNPLQKDLENARKAVTEAKVILAKENKDHHSDELLDIESALRKIREEKDGYMVRRGQVEGELTSAARLIKKQEELARPKEEKFIEMHAVEDLRDEILTYVETIEKSNNPTEIKQAVDAIRALFKAFVDMRRDLPTDNPNDFIRDTHHEIERLNSERNAIEKEIAKVVEEERKTETAYEQIRKRIENEKETNREAEKKLFESMTEEQRISSLLHDVASRENALAVLEADYKRDLGEFSIVLGHAIVLTHMGGGTREEQHERRKALEKIKIRLEDTGGGGEDTLKEYTAAIERDQFLEKELADLRTSAESLTVLITDLDTRISEEFESGLVKVNKEFQRFFALMFGGGEAALSVTKAVKRKKSDVEDLLESSSTLGADSPEEESESGIDISVSLPRKKVKGLIQLSGGERALTSIALLFAISQVNPPPFIILDETDAALDEANSKKYGDMIEQLSKYSQLIVITHNRETMSRAGALYGVTMGQAGVSKLLTVAFEEAVAVAK